MLSEEFRSVRCWRALSVCLALVGCSGEQAADWVMPVHALRVYSSPYHDVDWSNDHRLLAQHHDHVGANTSGLLAYDAAGYDVVSLMDYSGNRTLPWALRQRLWPVNQFVPDSLLPSLKSIKLFLPNAEEVGASSREDGQLKHVTSPFLETYIEGTFGVGVPTGTIQYSSLEQLFALVRTLGGLPCLAHPWNFPYDELELGDSFCVEIYSALAEAMRERNNPYYTAVDRNNTLIAHWDRALLRNQRIFAIAVNDHFGPQVLGPLSPSIRDSGKILVLAKAATLSAYREAFSAGSFFAVRDMGVVKGLYPRIHSVDIQDELIFLEAEGGTVTWVANGEAIGTGPMLLYSNLISGVKYVRAEVAGPDGSILYTQAFLVRPRGDVNGDYRVDAADDTLCAEVFAGNGADIDQRLACEARER